MLLRPHRLSDAGIARSRMTARRCRSQHAGVLQSSPSGKESSTARHSATSQQARSPKQWMHMAPRGRYASRARLPRRAGAAPRRTRRAGRQWRQRGPPPLAGVLVVRRQTWQDPQEAAPHRRAERRPGPGPRGARPQGVAHRLPRVARAGPGGRAHGVQRRALQVAPQRRGSSRVSARPRAR